MQPLDLGSENPPKIGLHMRQNYHGSKREMFDACQTLESRRSTRRGPEWSFPIQCYRTVKPNDSIVQFQRRADTFSDIVCWRFLKYLATLSRNTALFRYIEYSEYVRGTKVFGIRC